MPRDTCGVRGCLSWWTHFCRSWRMTRWTSSRRPASCSTGWCWPARTRPATRPQPKPTLATADATITSTMSPRWLTHPPCCCSAQGYHRRRTSVACRVATCFPVHAFHGDAACKHQQVSMLYFRFACERGIQLCSREVQNLSVAGVCGGNSSRTWARTSRGRWTTFSSRPTRWCLCRCWTCPRTIWCRRTRAAACPMSTGPPTILHSCPSSSTSRRPPDLAQLCSCGGLFGLVSSMSQSSSHVWLACLVVSIQKRGCYVVCAGFFAWGACDDVPHCWLPLQVVTCQIQRCCKSTYVHVGPVCDHALGVQVPASVFKAHMPLEWRAVLLEKSGYQGDTVRYQAFISKHSSPGDALGGLKASCRRSTVDREGTEKVASLAKVPGSLAQGDRISLSWGLSSGKYLPWSVGNCLTRLRRSTSAITCGESIHRACPALQSLESKPSKFLARGLYFNNCMQPAARVVRLASSAHHPTHQRIAG